MRTLKSRYKYWKLAKASKSEPLSTSKVFKRSNFYLFELTDNGLDLLNDCLKRYGVDFVELLESFSYVIKYDRWTIGSYFSSMDLLSIVSQIFRNGDSQFFHGFSKLDYVNLAKWSVNVDEDFPGYLVALAKVSQMSNISIPDGSKNYDTKEFVDFKYLGDWRKSIEILDYKDFNYFLELAPWHLSIPGRTCLKIIISLLVALYGFDLVKEVSVHIHKSLGELHPLVLMNLIEVWDEDGIRDQPVDWLMSAGLLGSLDSLENKTPY